jgi:DNA end-binding protein Ku
MKEGTPMARTKKRTRTKSKEAHAKSLPFHAFWSGALSFGLVNVPVLLFPATRHSGVHLRLISLGGTPLERRFYCPRDGREIASEEIVRGYELDDGSYITVSDDELEAIEPRKTREIELREFVLLSEVAPVFMERGYYLTPGKGAAKAYRLLADVMEKSERAGIATFVMRDREYLVAIFARNGILCAETLRFQNEVRDPRAIGLPVPIAPPRERVAAFERLISALAAKALSREKLADPDTTKLKAIIARKKKAGKALIHTHEETRDVDSGEQDSDDLVETIRRSLRK